MSLRHARVSFLIAVNSVAILLLIAGGTINCGVAIFIASGALPWLRAVSRAAARAALQCARDRAMTDQSRGQGLQDDQVDYRSLPPVAAATRRGRW